MLGIGMFEQEKNPINETYKGILSSEEIKKLVNDSDLLILSGVFVSDANFSPALSEIPENKTIQLFDRTLNMEGTEYPDIDMSALLDFLLKKAKKHPIANKFKITKEEFPENLLADNKEIIPMDIARGINDMINTHGNIPLAVDIGN